MKILVTNDDGIYSPGLWSVARALKEVGDIVVAAPDRDRSGVGPAVTLLDVVRANQITPPVEGIQTFAIEGNPADCVVLATESLVTGTIDMVVSGINQGSNVGMDILNSGTVGGAFQGYFRGIPSIAISVASLTDVQYEAAAHTARTLAQAITRLSLPGPVFLNVNLPNVTPDRIEQAEITRLGPRVYLESASPGYDGRRTHYWIKHNKPTNAPAEPGTDIHAIRNNRISITPLELIFGSMEPSPAFQHLADELTSELRQTTHS